MDLNNKRVLVVGLGKSGVASALFLKSRGARVTVSDSKPQSELRNEILILLEHGITVETGGHGDRTFRGQDLIVLRAEWEYACRAGTRTLFSSGARPPAAETANAWGVKNMHTGVAEWVFDWHGLYPSDPQTDPVGPAHGIARVIRGGGLDYKGAPKTDGGKHLPAEMPYYARSANRASMAPGFASPEHGIGFRVVQAAMPKTAPLP